MTALHDFIRAAASYYGVPPERLTEGCTLDASRGDLEVVLRIALTPEDVTGIAGRMQRMASEREVDADLATRLASVPFPGPQEMRAQYNALHPIEKSRFGSFARFCAMGGTLPEVPTFPEPVVMPAVELPPHVYVSHHDATEQQKAMAMGRDARGWFALDPADLTEQQRAKYLVRVTSNADDFGGLPG